VFIHEHLLANSGKTLSGIHIPQAGRWIRENVTIGDLQQMDDIVIDRFNLVRSHCFSPFICLILSLVGLPDLNR